MRLPADKNFLGGLDASSDEHKGYLFSLTPSEWCKDTGVKHEWATITVAKSVFGLRDDYDAHRNAIMTWMSE